MQRIGKMTLNRNPDNFFAEIEQVAFHVGNLVPGIDVTNDPLMQVRLFSLPRHPAHRASAGRTSPRSRSTGRSRRCTTTSRTGSTARPSTPARRTTTRTRIGDGQPTLAPMDRRLRATSPSRFSGVRTASAASRSRTTSARRACSSTASRRPSGSTSSRPFGSNSARSSGWIRERVVTDILANIDLELAQAVGPAVGVPNVARAPGARRRRRATRDRASPALSQDHTPPTRPTGRRSRCSLRPASRADKLDAVRGTLPAEGVSPRPSSPPMLEPVPGETAARSSDDDVRHAGPCCSMPSTCREARTASPPSSAGAAALAVRPRSPRALQAHRRGRRGCATSSAPRSAGGAGGAGLRRR